MTGPGQRPLRGYAGPIKGISAPARAHARFTGCSAPGVTLLQDPRHSPQEGGPIWPNASD